MTIYEKGDNMTSPFGPRRHPITGKQSHHNGGDISEGPGAKQRSTIPGNVEWVKYGHNFGRGNNVIIRQDTSMGTVRVRHQHADKILVKEGQAVAATDFVATEGASGDVTGSHDHFEVVIGGTLNRSTGEIVGGKAVDPSPWLGYPNKVGFYPRNDDIYYYDGNAPKEDDNVKFKIYAPTGKVVSSQQVSEGVIAVKGADGKMYGYVTGGDARMVREYTDATRSQVFEAMAKEMQAHELIISVD